LACAQRQNAGIADQEQSVQTERDLDSHQQGPEAVENLLRRARRPHPDRPSQRLICNAPKNIFFILLPLLLQLPKAGNSRSEVEHLDTDLGEVRARREDQSPNSDYSKGNIRSDIAKIGDAEKCASIREKVIGLWLRNSRAAYSTPRLRPQ